MQHLKRILAIFALATIATFANAQAPDTVRITPPVDSNKVCKVNQYTATFNFTGTDTILIKTFITTATNMLHPVCPPDSSTSVDPIQMAIVSTTNCTFTPAGTNKWRVVGTGNATVVFSLYADCSILNDPLFADTSNHNTNIFLGQAWINTATNDSILIKQNSITAKSAKSGLYYPYLARQYNGSSFFANYKGTKDSTYLYFFYGNTGSIPADIKFNFLDTIISCNGYVKVGNPSFAVAHDTIGKDTIAYQSFTPGLTIGGDSTTIPHLYFLIIRQRVAVTGCIPCQNQTASFRWHCRNALSSCIACLRNYTTTYKVDTVGTKHYKVYRITPSAATARSEKTCPNNSQQWKFRIINDGTVAIDYLRVNLDDILDNSVVGLGLIDKSTITLTRSVPAVTVLDSNLSVITNDSLKYCNACFHNWTGALCNTAIPNPVSRITFLIHDLMPQTLYKAAQYLDVSFLVYRCVQDSDLALLNKNKVYNNWQLSTQPKDECGISYTIGIKDSTTDYGYGPGISANLYKFKGIDQILSFSPSFSDLSIPPGLTGAVRYGDIAPMTIGMNGILSNGDSLDYMFFGCSGTPKNCNLKGILRARIFCASGLLALDSAATFSYGSYSSPPVHFHAVTNNPFSCGDGFYYYYFNLGDPNAYNYTNNGQFNFLLQACCPTANGLSNYEIDFQLLMDPDSCYKTILGSPYNYNKLDTTALTWLPLSGVSNTISTHCPGCKSLGIIVEKYYLHRVTYGLKDSNNDRLADASLTQIDSSNYYTHFNQINKTASMHGDKLFDRLVSHLQDGTNITTPQDPIPGYTYAQMVANNSLIHYLQLQRSIPGMDSALNIRIEKFTLYIDKRDTSNTGTCYDCIPFGVLPSKFRTVTVLDVHDSDALFSYILSSPSLHNRLYTFHDSILVYHSTHLQNIIFQDSTTAFRFTNLDVNQQYRLSVTYHVCGNITDNSGSLERIESDINNYMWVSGSVHVQGDSLQPNDEYYLNLAGWTAYNNAGYTQINQAFANRYRFQCEAYGGRHYFYTNTFGVSSYFNSGAVANCGKSFTEQFNSYIGNGNQTKDYFPYEFRRPALTPHILDISMPYGFAFQNGNATLSTFSYYLDTVNFVLNKPQFTVQATVPLVQPDSCHLTTANLPPVVCFSDTSIHLLNTGDQYFQMTMNFNLRDTTCNNASTLDTLLKTQTLFNDSNNFVCAGASNTFCSLDSLVKSNINMKSQGKLPNPDLHLSYTLQTIPVTLQHVCWQFFIHNNSYAAPYDTTTNASNVFIVPPVSNFLTNWTIVSNGVSYPATAGTAFIIDTTLEKNFTVSDSLCAVIDSCPGNLSITLPLYWGWNCKEPVVFPYTCRLDTSAITLDLSGAALQAGVLPVDSFSLCQQFTITSYYTPIKAGSLNPQQAIIDSLPPGLSILNCTASLHHLGTITSLSLTTTPDSLTWYLPSGILLTDSLFLPDTLFIYLTVKPTCGYVGDDGALPAITLIADKYCHAIDSVPASFPHIPQSISHPSLCLDCFTITKTASNPFVLVGQPFSYDITICSHGISQNVTLTDSLPLAFSTTTTFPQTIYVYKDSCVTITVAGTFTYPDSCPSSNNEAILSTNYGSTFTADACIDAIEPCSVSPDVTFLDSTSASDAIYNGVTHYNNQTIFVQGVFYVDVNLSFIQCTIEMNAGAQIILVNNDSTDMHETTIEGCTNMWRNITVSSGSKLFLTEWDTIRDADTALIVHDKTYIHIDHSAIIDDVSALVILKNNSGYNNVTLDIWGNTFGLYATAFKPNYLGQPSLGLVPRIGIEINDWVGTIGNAQSLPVNIFHNLSAGIHGYRSRFKLVNNYFEQIRADAAYNVSYKGTAMSSIGTKLRNGDLAITPYHSPATMVLNSDQGVYTEWSNLEANSLDFKNVGYGFYSTSCTNGLHSHIGSCTINCYVKGIRWRTNSGASFMIAENNIITARTRNCIGIYLSEKSNTNPATYNIYNNRLFVDTALTGISANSIYNAQINCNIIHFTGNSTSPTEGIVLQTCDSATVFDNYTTGQYPTNTNRVYGISTYTSKQSFITCNTTDSTKLGIFFDGQCTQTHLNGNNMYTHLEGLRLTNVAVIDTQTLAGNLWYGPFTGYGAYNYNSPLSNVWKSIFLVDTSFGSYAFPSTPPVFNLLWFRFANGQTYTCPNINTCTTDHQGNRGSESLMQAIAKGDTLTSDFIEESKQIAKMILYEILKVDSIHYAADSILMNFKSQNENSSIGQLYNVKRNLKTLTLYDSQFKSLLLETDSLIDIHKAEINSLDSISAADSTINNHHQRDSIIAIINNLQITWGNIVTQRDAFVNGKILDAKAINATIVPDGLPQTNEKFINFISLLSDQYGTDTLLYYFDDMLSIAMQCPDVGGQAVYRARPFVSIFNDSLMYDDETTCLQFGIFRQMQTLNDSSTFISNLQKEKLKEDVQLVPNPADKKIDIFVKGIDAGICRIEISNALGKKVIIDKMNCKEKSHTVNTSNLIAGVYNVKLFLNNAAPKVVKLIIAR
jgi:hypothetical protein